MQTRYFNDIKIEDNTFYKSSDLNPQKIENEYKWLDTISQIESLKKYVPDNVQYKDNVLSMKYYESGDLGQKLFKKVSKKEMRDIIDKLINIFLDFKEIKVDREIKYDGFYSKIVNNRINHNSLYKKYKYYLVNEKLVDDINTSLLFDKCKELNYTMDIGVVHGDLFFSNILIDGDNFKLIDPRGSINDEFSIYGDRRYDLAKLRHSISGGYDYIINNKYSLSYKNNIVDYKIDFNYDNYDATRYFDQRVRYLGYNVDDIKFIEGLLFLNMIPLHKENFEHQLLFYMTSLEKIGTLYE